MRCQGRVNKWLDSKGYGFVVINGESETIFAHINDFQKSAGRPQAGDLVTFEIVKHADKGSQAINIEYVNRQVAKSKPKQKARDWMAYLVAVVLIICILGYWSWGKSTKPLLLNETKVSEPAVTSQPLIQNASFQCSGKTRCSEMVSCDEAKFYLSHCLGTVTDGDGDGIPCEEQWCGH